MKLFLINVCFVLPIIVFSQNPDSLKRELKLAKHDTTKIQLQYQIAEADMIFRLAYWDSLINEIDSKKEDYSQPRILYVLNVVKAASLNNLGYIHRTKGNVKDAEINYKSAIKLRSKLANDRHFKFEKNIHYSEIAWIYNNLSNVYELEGNQSMEFECLKFTYEYYSRIKDQAGIAMSYNNIASYYNDIGDIAKALEYNYKALNLNEKLKNKEYMAYNLNNLGLIYQLQGEISKANDYFNKSLKLHKEVNNKAGMAMVLHNIASVVDDEGDGSKALPYYFNSLKIKEELNNKSGVAYTLNNIASIYLKQRKIDLALKYYKECLAIRESIHELNEVAYTLSYMAEAYSLANRIDLAISLAERSFQLSRELKRPANIMTSSAVLKSLYKLKGKYKEAFSMYELEMQMRDSLNNAVTKKAAIKKQFQYQYEKKAAADSVKNAEAQKVKNAQLQAQSAQLKQERTQRFALYGGLGLVIAFSIFVYNRFRLTQKQKILIEKQKGLVDNAYLQLHERNQEVMDSIHYAARIQRSLITNEKYIAKMLNKLHG